MRLQTITRKRGESGALSAIAGMVSQADHLSYHVRWAREGLADGADLPPDSRPLWA
jgi:hypothetical protein